MTTKITKTDKFNALRSLLADYDENTVIGGVCSAAEMEEFIIHEIDLIAKKNARKGSGTMTKVQKANADMALVIAKNMEQDRAYTVTEICNDFEYIIGKVSTQKVTQILFRRKDLFENIKDGKKSLYKRLLVTNDENEGEEG